MFNNFYTAAAAAAAFFATANGHMIMKSPKPFGGSSLDNSPLTSANYPCKVTGDKAGFYSTEGLDNTMAIGEKQTLSFTGSAVHGGGSCQLAITEDMQPSASTSWQVILSIEGGCPSKDGQGPSEYEFVIPEGIAPGPKVFQWSWISKLAGQPEFYQNCAPITVTGGSGKRSECNETMALASRADEFPELFVANLADINSCKTTPGTDPQFPNPGKNVEKLGSSNNFAKVEGSDCVPKGASAGGSGGSGSGSDSGSGSGSESDGSGANGGSGSGDAGSGSAPATSAAAAVPSTPATAPSSSAPAPAAPPASSGFVTSVKPSSSVAAAPQASSAAAAPAAPAPSSAPSGSASGAAAGGRTGACTDEGTFNCVGGSYQQCASGAWTAMIQMPAGTKCKEGQSMDLWA